MKNEAELLINKLMEYYNVSTISELATHTNTSQPAISQWKKKNYVKAIKKKCRELGIYDEIFGDQNSFTQYGKNSQQIGTQDNQHSSNINNFGNDNGKDQDVKIDNDILKLMEALNSVANALNKKEELKNELTNLISKLPTL